MVVRNVTILGSGPAGLTAAIYAARARLQPLVLAGEPSSTGDQPGGQLMLTTEVENYPGFVEGITGPELMEALKAQALRFGAEVVTTKATRVRLGSRPFGIWVDDSSAEEPSYLSDSVIIATGSQSLMLGLENETRLLGHGVSTCATCDGFFFRNQEIAVVGGGDSALEEAIFLTKFASKVTLIHRRDELRASKIMQDRALSNHKMQFLWNTTVIDIIGESSVAGVSLRNVITGEQSRINVTGLFVAIGHQPNTAIFKGQLEMDDRGYVLTQGKSTRTTIEGVFACGDVQDPTYRQAITAAGSGCSAAIDAERWLETKRHEQGASQALQFGQR